MSMERDDVDPRADASECAAPATPPEADQALAVPLIVQDQISELRIRSIKARMIEVTSWVTSALWCRNRQREWLAPRCRDAGPHRTPEHVAPLACVSNTRKTLFKT